MLSNHGSGILRAASHATGVSPEYESPSPVSDDQKSCAPTDLLAAQDKRLLVPRQTSAKCEVRCRMELLVICEVVD